MHAREIEVVEGRCRICGAYTEILRVTEFNLKVCRSCYPRFYERRVRKALESNQMLAEADHAVVAVSGGKDSAALLCTLSRLSVVMGFDITAIHFHLGMGEYSDANLEVVERQCAGAGVSLEVTPIEKLGLRVSRVKAWQPCAVCGAIKRALMNREAGRLGATVVATAHTLEDMLLFALKNILSRKFYIPPPVLEPVDGLKRKIKPLMFTPERLNLAYCQLRDMPVCELKCPQWSPKAHALKEVFEVLEDRAPSGKLQLLLSLMEAMPAKDEYAYRPTSRCPRCGEPTTQSLCALCRLAEWFAGRYRADVEIEL